MGSTSSVEYAKSLGSGMSTLSSRNKRQRAGSITMDGLQHCRIARRGCASLAGLLCDVHGPAEQLGMLVKVVGLLACSRSPAQVQVHP